MRIVRRVPGLALLIAFVLTTGLVAGDEDQPAILIEKMRHELGKVYEKKKFRHTFKVKNTGTANLEIEQVKPG